MTLEAIISPIFLFFLFFLFFLYLAPLLLLLIPFLFPSITMITTFLKNKNHLHHHHSTAPSSPGLGLLTTLTKHGDQDSKLPNLVESSSSMLNSPSTANGLLFIDGGDEDDNGITSCTESLGFESSNESRIVYDHQQEQEIIHNNNMNRKERRRGGRKAASVRSFPPPLTSLTRNGQPSFFLRPVRKDGRLELTQVRIQRQDILHAWRQDGRLRLHLIPDRTLFEEEQEQAAYERHQQQDQEENDDDELEQVHDEHEHEEEVIGYGKDNNNNQWSSRYGNEYEGGLKRCYQMVNMDINMNMNHHHHHHHHGHHHMQMCGISIV